MKVSKRLVFPGITVGLVVLLLAILLKPAPKQVTHYDNARSVKVMTLQQTAVAPLVEGFGRVSPKHIWQAVAEVNGKVVYRHPQLETGRILPKGTVVLKIDPLEYQLKLTQALANLASINAQLVKLDQQQINLQTSLKIEQQKLTLANQEYQRKLTLSQRNLVSSSDLESQKQALLVQQNAVENIQNSLNVWPDDKKVSLAQKDIDISQVKDAQRQLSKTQIVLPFDSRVSDVNIQNNQVVNAGSVMFVAYQLGTAEIKAELSLQNMRTLVQSLGSISKDENNMPSIEDFNLTGEVQFQAGNNHFSWPAKVTRVAESVNPNQGTIGVYLEVAQQYRQLDLLQRPPLTKGMFVKASITGASSKQFTVPEHAIHTNQLYIKRADNRLAIVPITVLYRTKDSVVVAGAIKQGDEVVLNDLIPAIEGMRLKTVSGSLKAVKDAPVTGAKQ
ncbi:efflux RND transporter periplasmic adaptor subunit [Shewanella intestini]|uniref:HlyD family efflux transporter periplasmic adaptor subunit n=1 Tax=Shewanella intestini TaxID=2017544 RepID=A0ABS5I4P9_9GAMM|nr:MULTISPECIES: HlyD family efflux transporter periplasmic adaptor subunit [Shewanella]MBR9729007.1 HlyD family efflux transporter periplasmic adaptor subunit [Shewanella intestini]MRG36927.1 HlyD family efflux transporter periplasmic adaptor subunit [Shewanella sp. XMDDZSB0408]